MSQNKNVSPVVKIISDKQIHIKKNVSALQKLEQIHIKNFFSSLHKHYPPNKLLDSDVGKMASALRSIFEEKFSAFEKQTSAPPPPSQPPLTPSTPTTGNIPKKVTTPPPPPTTANTNSSNVAKGVSLYKTN